MPFVLLKNKLTEQRRQNGDLLFFHLLITKNKGKGKSRLMIFLCATLSTVNSQWLKKVPLTMINYNSIEHKIHSRK